MDAVDRQLIAALRANARASYAELGRLVGLSGPSVTDRVNRLEETGVITGYRALVAPKAIGLGVSALVGLLLSELADHDRVAGRLRDIAEVEDCWFIAGDDSFLVKVRVRDVDALAGVVGRLSAVPGVARARTTVVLSTYWEGRLPAPAEDERP
jgi:Lrp/AsnC family transcriptional regulator, leucine-responsive regulatory protein